MFWSKFVLLSLLPGGWSSGDTCVAPKDRLTEDILTFDRLDFADLQRLLAQPKYDEEMDGRIFEGRVREKIDETRRRLKTIEGELEAIMSEKYGTRAASVPKFQPSFQWAQNADSVFLQIKFAVRWSSPVSAWPENLEKIVEVRRLFVAGTGGESGGRKAFELDLELFDEVVPDETVWSDTSVGKITVTLKKKEIGKWRALLASEKRLPNMGWWLEMSQELEGQENDDDEKEESVEIQTSKSVKSRSKGTPTASSGPSGGGEAAPSSE